jgi:beta-lactamase class C
MNLNPVTRLILITSILVILVVIITFSFLTNKKSRVDLPDTEQCAVDTSPEQKLVHNYEDFFVNAFDSTNTVGAALTIVYNNKIMLLKPYGVKKTGTNDSVNTHTIFRLASVSKGFAGVLACILEKDSLISLDERVSTIIPGFRLKDSINTSELTILNILSHTTGLVPHAFDNLIEEGVSLPMIIQELPTVEISAKPGVLYSYQNVIFSLFDSIVLIKTGMPYDELLEKKIFKPLKMRDASANPEVFRKKRGNIAYPHSYSDSIPVMLPVNVGYYNLKLLPAVNASISDISANGSLHCWATPRTFSIVLFLRKSLRRLLKALCKGVTSEVGPDEAKYYSLGWRIYIYKGRKIIYHGGM